MPRTTLATSTSTWKSVIADHPAGHSSQLPTNPRPHRRRPRRRQLPRRQRLPHLPLVVHDGTPRTLLSAKRGISHRTPRNGRCKSLTCTEAFELPEESPQGYRSKHSADNAAGRTPATPPLAGRQRRRLRWARGNSPRTQPPPHRRRGSRNPPRTPPDDPRAHPPTRDRRDPAQWPTVPLPGPPRGPRGLPQQPRTLSAPLTSSCPPAGISTEGMKAPTRRPLPRRTHALHPLPPPRSPRHHLPPSRERRILRRVRNLPGTPRGTPPGHTGPLEQAARPAR